MNPELPDDTIERLIKSAGPRPAVAADRAARVRANVHQAWRNEVDAQKTRRRFLWTLPLAAALALAAVLTFVRKPSDTHLVARVAARVERTRGVVEGLSGASVMEGASVTTAPKSGASFRIANGTSIRIDESSRVRFDAPNKLLLESGAVYIDATQSGMQVRTPFGIVRDVGTRFEVRLLEAAAQVRVRDGEVALGQHHARRGEQLVLARSGEVTTTAIPTWGDAWNWTMDLSPHFAIEGARVSEFLTWVSAESGFEVRYDSQATEKRAGSATLHGSIGELRPDVAAEAILPTARLRSTIRDGVLTVKQ